MFNDTRWERRFPPVDEKLRHALIDDEGFEDFLNPERSEALGDTLLAASGRTPPMYLPTFNLPNDGSIENLPEGAIVEVPGMIGAGGARGQAVGEVPEHLATIFRRMLVAHHHAVEAGAKGSRDQALLSLSFEPTVRELTVVEDLLDDLLDFNYHAGYIPESIYSDLRRGGGGKPADYLRPALEVAKNYDVNSAWPAESAS